MCFIYCHQLSWAVIYSSFNLNTIRQKICCLYLLFPNKTDRIVPLSSEIVSDLFVWQCPCFPEYESEVSRIHFQTWYRPQIWKEWMKIFYNTRECQTMNYVCLELCHKQRTVDGHLMSLSFSFIVKYFITIIFPLFRRVERDWKKGFLDWKSMVSSRKLD